MIKTKNLSWLTVILACTLISACGQQPDEAPAAEPEAAQNGAAVSDEAVVSIYAAAVAEPARPDADKERDAQRKPAEVLAFLGIKPGMIVLDMFTGGGYYAEIIASIVGDEGKVVAHSNRAYLNFVGDAFKERFSSGRLTNVEVLMAENNELSLEADTFDAIMLVLSFHDLYHANPEHGWERIDAPVFLAELRQALKPGGIVGIVDHYAQAGAPGETGDTVHRIDPAIVITDMEAAGFTLAAQSDMLRNPNDDLSKIVFAPELRGKTDRFVMRFQKTE